MRWLTGRPFARSLTNAASAAGASPAASAARAARSASESSGCRSLSGSGSGRSALLGSGSGNPAATAVRNVATRVPSSAARRSSASRRGLELPATSSASVAVRSSAGPSASLWMSRSFWISRSFTRPPDAPPARRQQVHHERQRGHRSTRHQHQTCLVQCDGRLRDSADRCTCESFRFDHRFQ